MPKKFFTASEEVTYNKINAVCEKFGAKVFSKVRLIDVLRCYPNSPKGRNLTFALKAHLDYVIISEEGLPLFSVEYDGPSHNNPEQKERDGIKDKLLSERDYPLLRVNSNYLEIKYRGFDLLSYFIDIWFLWESFNKAQENGVVPDDELFDPDFFLTGGGNYEKPWPWNLSYDVRREMEKLHFDGKTIQFSPNHIIGIDKDDNSRCIAWIFINPDLGVLVETGMKKKYFPAVSESDVLIHLATFDLYDLIIRVSSGEKEGVTPDQILDAIQEFKSFYKVISASGGGYSKQPNFTKSVSLFSNNKGL